MRQAKELSHTAETDLKELYVERPQVFINNKKRSNSSRLYVAIMRITDITVASIGIIIAFPLFLLISILVKLDSSGKVMFVQDRVGLNRRMGERRTDDQGDNRYNNGGNRRKSDRRTIDKGGRVFKMFKFRSMRNDAEETYKNIAHLNAEPSGLIIKIPNDPRVTRIGKFLRRTSLDEIPQLFNIVKKDMSLVGPRPPSSDEVAQYNSRQRRRLEVIPGLTGLWQISGRKDTNFDYMVDKDIEYIEKQSIWLNMKIILKTIPCIINGKGAR